MGKRLVVPDAPAAPTRRVAQKSGAEPKRSASSGDFKPSRKRLITSEEEDEDGACFSCDNCLVQGSS